MNPDDALHLARTLLDAHGLDDWQVSLDHAKRRAGSCRHDRRLLTLSRPLAALHDEAEVRETVLHEIAHALVGPAHGHDATWRAAARRIGSTGERCVAPDAPQVPGAWQGTCPAGHTTERHRRPERVASCSRCSRGFDPTALITWTHHGRTVPMHPTYVAELAALRAGRASTRLTPGTAVTLPRRRELGRWAGRRAVVRSVGRSRYRLTTHDGRSVTVPFGLLDAGVAG